MPNLKSVEEFPPLSTMNYVGKQKTKFEVVSKLSWRKLQHDEMKLHIKPNLSGMRQNKNKRTEINDDVSILFHCIWIDLMHVL